MKELQAAQNRPMWKGTNISDPQVNFQPEPTYRSCERAILEAILQPLTECSMDVHEAKAFPSNPPQTADLKKSKLLILSPEF